MLPKSEAKYIQSLHHKKFRDEHAMFIAEGPKVVGELLRRQPDWIRRIYGTKDWLAGATTMDVAAAQAVFTEVEKFELEKISALQTPQQVLAIAERPVFSYQATDEWILALDGIQDPGNLGTIIRTAHWFGIQQVLCSMDCADAFSPKVVQAAMGSVFKVKTIYLDLAAFFTSYDQPVYGAMLQGKNVANSTAVSGCLVIGSEGKGIRSEVASCITQKLTIAGHSDAESLNAAVAAGILLQWACG